MLTSCECDAPMDNKESRIGRRPCRSDPFSSEIFCSLLLTMNLKRVLHHHYSQIIFWLLTTMMTIIIYATKRFWWNQKMSSIITKEAEISITIITITCSLDFLDLLRHRHHQKVSAILQAFFIRITLLINIISFSSPSSNLHPEQLSQFRPEGMCGPSRRI